MARHVSKLDHYMRPWHETLHCILLINHYYSRRHSPYSSKAVLLAFSIKLTHRSNVGSVAFMCLVHSRMVSCHGHVMSRSHVMVSWSRVMVSCHGLISTSLLSGFIHSWMTSSSCIRREGRSHACHGLLVEFWHRWRAICMHTAPTAATWRMERTGDLPKQSVNSWRTRAPTLASVWSRAHVTINGGASAASDPCSITLWQC